MLEWEHGRLFLRQPTWASKALRPDQEVAPILSRNPRILLHLTLVGLAFGGLAGCLSPDAEEEPEFLVSRVHTLSVNRETTSRADAAPDPESAVKEMLRTDLVVRVGSVGDYSLEYTNRLGVVKTQSLLAAAPGLPATVGDVDPFAPATLRKGTEVVYERKAAPQAWWHVGDVPLGFTMTPGASASYASTGSLTESLSLSDIDVPEGDFHLDTLKFTLSLPLDGTLSYELGAEDATDGAPLEISGSYFIPAGKGDLVTAEVKATQNGAVGTGGVKAGVEKALAKAEVTVWMKDGQPVAGQFRGAELDVQPRVTMWADGFLGEMAEGMSCAGTSKGDNCKPEEIEPIHETTDSEEKQELPVDEFPQAGDGEDERKAIEFLRTLFAQDIRKGDKVQLIATYSQDDFGAPSGFDGEGRTEFVLEAVGPERVSVRAGDYDALKLVETFHTVTRTDGVTDGEGNTLLKALTVNETLTRTTFWLDADTYQPLKMVAETPVDIDRLVRNVLDAVGADAWEQSGMEPVRPDQWKITATAESSYEAVTIDPETRFSAVAGLTLAHLLSSSGASLPMGFLGVLNPFAGPGYYDEAIPVEARPYRSLSLTSNGPLVDGVKTYTVSTASPDFLWGDVYLSLDGDTLFQDVPAVCGVPTEPFWIACGDATSVEESDDAINAGDLLRLPAKSGQTLRVIDPYTNSVLLVLTVA